MGKKKEKYTRRESAECVYIGFYRWNHRRPRPVGIPVSNYNGEWATSLYGDPGLNPSVIPSVKSSEKIQRHHTVSYFQNSIQSIGNTVGIYRRNNSVGTYRPYCQRNLCRW